MDGWMDGQLAANLDVPGSALDLNPAGTHCRCPMPLVAGLRDASRGIISEQPTRLGWFLALFQPGTTAAVHAAHSTEAGAPTSLVHPHSCSPGTRTKGLWVLGSGSWQSGWMLCARGQDQPASLGGVHDAFQLANHGLAST